MTKTMLRRLSPSAPSLDELACKYDCQLTSGPALYTTSNTHQVCTLLHQPSGSFITMPKFDITHLLFPFAEQGVQHCHAGRVLLGRCQREVHTTLPILVYG